MNLPRIFSLAAIILVIVAMSGAAVGYYSRPADFTAQDPQIAGGSWTIEVQVPPCDNGYLQLLPPEREGDVITIYCKQFAVKEK